MFSGNRARNIFNKKYVWIVYLSITYSMIKSLTVTKFIPINYFLRISFFRII